MNETVDHELMTRKELAEALKVSERKIMRMEEEGLPVLSLGDKSPRYVYTQVMDWIEKRQEK